ncbi:hypothetical protein J4Q44_G00108280 [Coregonus suidteri]|uniref:Uncharacterized protein n=1 Tax=Coregonus suidteri TaxID=861788 RepID=A0AAN8M5P9_9TELE
MVDDEDAADAPPCPWLSLRLAVSIHRSTAGFGSNVSVVCFDSISFGNSVCPVAFTIKQKCELSNGHHEFILTFSNVLVPRARDACWKSSHLLETGERETDGKLGGGRGLPGGVILQPSRLSLAGESSRRGPLLTTMKGLGANRNRHLSDSCDPTQGPPEPLYPHQASTLPRSPYLLSPTSMDHYGTMDPHHYNPSVDPHYNQGSLPPDYSLPLNNQLSNSSTFPRIHYNAHYYPSDLSPPQEDSIGGIRTGTLGTSMSMGMGMGMGMHGSSGMGGLQSSRGSMITSGSATISGGAKMNRQLAPNLLDQLDKQLPGGPRDGFSTLQFHRSTSAALSAASKQRTDSPGRIRNLVCSVQKLFAKSQSMDGHNLKGVNGRSGAGSGSGGTSSGTEDGGKRDQRAKSKDRGGAKSDRGGTGKRRPRSNMSGYWSSDDLDSADLSNYRNPIAMTLGRPTAHATQHATHGTTYDSQQGALQQQQQGQQSRYVVHSGYNTISSSKSNNEVMKYQQALLGPGDGGGGRRRRRRRWRWDQHGGEQ